VAGTAFHGRENTQMKIRALQFFDCPLLLLRLSPLLRHHANPSDIRPHLTVRLLGRVARPRRQAMDQSQCATGKWSASELAMQFLVQTVESQKWWCRSQGLAGGREEQDDLCRHPCHAQYEDISINLEVSGKIRGLGLGWVGIGSCA
jgi:hypothetical protein